MSDTTRDVRRAATLRRKANRVAKSNGMAALERYLALHREALGAHAAALRARAARWPKPSVRDGVKKGRARAGGVRDARRGRLRAKEATWS